MIAYRDATLADGPALEAMARAIWIETFGPHATEEEQADYLDEHFGPDGLLLRELPHPDHRFRLACADGRIAGYASLATSREEDTEPNSLQLTRFFVASEWQGKGVAQALMAWAIDAARARGATALLLTVWEGNDRALRFYRRQGFAPAPDYGFALADLVGSDVILRLALPMEAAA